MSIIIKSGASGNLMTVDSSGAARVSLYDPSGSALSNVTVSGSVFQGNSTTQTTFVSTNNSSTTNLTSGSTFTGTADTLLGYGAIQVEFITSQQATIQVQQSNDGTNWDVIDSYVVLASTGDSRTFVATGTSVRILVTNNGGSTTTSLRLQTRLAPIVPPMPRSLTTLGNLKVAIAETTHVKTTYSAVVNNLTPPATPTDMVTITGSATRTIRILKVEISTLQTTAGINTFFLIKRSTADTSGTSASVTAIPHDSGDAAATATVLSYTANPTLGTTIGTVRASKLLTPASTTTQSGVYVWDFDDLNGKPVILRGTSQVLAVNFNGAALPSGLNVNCSIEWTEEV